jgi:hypothetical protein
MRLADKPAQTSLSNCHMWLLNRLVWVGSEKRENFSFYKSLNSTELSDQRERGELVLTEDAGQDSLSLFNQFFQCLETDAFR